MNDPAQDINGLYQQAVKLYQAGKLPEAEAILKQVVVLDRNHADAFNNLGVILTQNGKVKEGLLLLERSVALKPEFDLLKKIGEEYFSYEVYNKAVQYLYKAYALNQRDEELSFKLAKAFYNDGRYNEAVTVLQSLIDKNPHNRAYHLTLQNFYSSLSFTSYKPLYRKVMLAHLQQENIVFTLAARAFYTLFKVDPAFEKIRAFGEGKDFSLQDMQEELGDELLCLALETMPVVAPDYEVVLTKLRAKYTLSWAQAAEWPKASMRFLTALATQCWFNEYVFLEAPDETKAVESIKAHLISLKDGKKEFSIADVLLALIFSSYRPLSDIVAAGEKLPLSKGHNYNMKDILKLQLKGPLREKEIAEALPSFTEVTDDISKAVKAQYEHRPYPRWRTLNLPEEHEDLKRMTADIDVLVAGCGTGQEPCKNAANLQGAHVTAIDLSFASIAYGKRMAEEGGLDKRITFMQGDLMDVSTLGKQFDIITSTGVLHHMKEPAKGLHALASVLKPSGRMSISLYSRMAREHYLGPVWKHIKEKGYKQNDDDIRKLRFDILALPEDHEARRVTELFDFYNLSECCDLLFHVNEHSYTLPEIRAMVAAEGFQIHDVRLRPSYMILYKEMFPENPATNDIDQLHTFEEKHPHAFIGMYRMWLHRAGVTLDTRLMRKLEMMLV